MRAKAASQLMSGSKLPAVVSAISTATCQYVIAASTINSVNIAVGPGSGTQIGKIIGLSTRGMSSMMLLRGATLGLIGRDAKKFFDAVSFGVVTSMNAVVMQGVIIGAGPGTGTGKIIGLLPTALLNIIYANAIFRLIAGSQMRRIMSAVSFGICTHITTFGTVTITDIGAFTPPPVGPVPIPAAPGIGRFY